MPVSNLRPCKVIIAGGGIAGLTLALILERVGIDYVLLEAYSDIVAVAGAGMTMLPNGLRILDQLGCMEDLVNRAGQTIQSMSLRNSKGEVMKQQGDWHHTCPERYGYPFFWVDRKVLLQVIYDHVIDKSKLLTRRRVGSVNFAEGHVEVITTDGSSYHGDVLVGADGAHSQVRKEMVRYAHELGIGEDYAEDHTIPATYSCIFGVSSALPGVDNACIDFVANKNYSYTVGSGPKNRTYWFFSLHMGQTFYGADIPEFTEQDMDQVAKEHWNDTITPEVRFSDLYKNKLNALYSPMREIVFKKWHLDRAIIVGDSAHQMTSVLGQGGNQAMESVAALANSLFARLSDSSASGPLSIGEIHAAFQQTQEARQQNVTRILEASHNRNRMDAMVTPEMEEIMMVKFPAAFPGAVLKRWDEAYAPAVSLHMLDIPYRPKKFQFLDELARETVGDANRGARL